MLTECSGPMTDMEATQKFGLLPYNLLAAFTLVYARECSETRFPSVSMKLPIQPNSPMLVLGMAT